MIRRFLAITTLIALVFVPAMRGDKPKLYQARPEGIDGTLVMCGEKIPDAALDRFFEFAGNDKAHIVLVISRKRADPRTVQTLTATWRAKKPASLVIMANDEASEKSKEALRKATGVWLFDRPTFNTCEDELNGVLVRGGVVGASNSEPFILFDVLYRFPVFGVVPVKLPEGRDTPVKPRTDHLAVKVQEKATLIVRGRQMTVVGDGTATIRLPKSATLPERIVEITAKSPTDLTWLRRCAIARAGEPFPPKNPPTPEVPKGSLLIVGGGGMPADVTKKFIDLAGGPDALIVVLPTAQPEPLPLGGANEGAFLTRAGAKHVVVLNARKLEDVESPKNLELVKKAGGVWFGGGRQWRFVDAYEGTKMHAAFKEVLARGGVIGGSSAGATIQGDYLCRGSPFNNTDMMCEGYERGLGFLPGVAIDQHFAQRKRFADMTALMKSYPQLFGIGLDEATAIVVQGHMADVMGKGEVHFYDRKKPIEKDKPDHESIKAGGRYDLKERKVVAAEGK